MSREFFYEDTFFIYNQNIMYLYEQGGLLNLARAYNDAGGIFVSSILHAVNLFFSDILYNI